MTLFWSLLPLYLFGNFHCLGMCGPLVALLGRHRFRYFYFLGRTCSFTLLGGIAGGLGEVLTLFFSKYHIAPVTSMLFGWIIFFVGLGQIFGYSKGQLKGGIIEKVQRGVSLLLLRDRALSTFLFGLATVLLPCGQTLIVFAACALSGDIGTGLMNGMAFAILTSPSLFFAMQLHRLAIPFKKYANRILGIFALIIGMMAFCRGLAELGWIDHWILNKNADSHYHIVMY